MSGHCQSDYRSQIDIRLPDLQGGMLDITCDVYEVTFERFRVPADVSLRMLAVIHQLEPDTGRARGRRAKRHWTDRRSALRLW